MTATNKPVSVTLDGKKYKMWFDLNTFDAFETASGGKFFLEFLASMQEALASIPPIRTDKHGKSIPPKPEDMFGFLRKLSIKDLRAFVWAALHDYDRNGEPVWPLTIGQMGRLVTTDTIPEIISLVMKGTQDNSPSPDDLKEYEGPERQINEGNARPIRAGETAPASGGPDSGPSDADILGSLTRNSAD